MKVKLVGPESNWGTIGESAFWLMVLPQRRALFAVPARNTTGIPTTNLQRTPVKTRST